MSRTIIVGGNYRGGTSAVAGLLQMAGVFMGKARGPNREDIEIRDRIINRRSATGINLSEVVTKRNRTHPLWGFKYPGVHNLFPDLLAQFENPHVVFVFRDPVAVATSEKRRRTGNNDFWAMFERTNQYNTRMGNLRGMGCPVHFLSFERLLTRKEQEITKLMKFCKIENYDLEKMTAFVQLEDVPTY